MKKGENSANLTNAAKSQTYADRKRAPFSNITKGIP